MRFLFRGSAIALGTVLGAAQVMAVDTLPTVICTGLAGCGSAPANTLFDNIIPAAIALGIQGAAGLAVVFIIVSGLQMLLAYGDDSKAGAARKHIMIALGGLGLALLSATIVSFVTTEDYGQNEPTDLLFGSGGLLASVVRICVTVFNAGFVISVILAGLRMVTAAGSQDEFKKGGAIIKWSITGAVIINLARAIVQAFLNFNF